MPSHSHSTLLVVSVIHDAAERAGRERFGVTVLDLGFVSVEDCEEEESSEDSSDDSDAMTTFSGF